MTPHKRSIVSNGFVRSGYGDMHAHRNALMMEEHVAMLRAHDMIDETMAINLLEPLHKCWAYTEEYLKTHPEYTGVQPEMTAYTTAMRHKKERDVEMAKFVADLEAGRIDEWGDPIGSDEDSASENAKNSRCSSTSTDTDRNTASPLTSPADPLTITIRPPPKMLSNNPAQSDSPGSDLTWPSSSCSASSSSKSSPKSQSQPQSQSPSQGRKRKYRVEPLAPLPGGEDYCQYKYYQLLAICRDRNIHCPGDTQEVRNLLIQDDINIARGLPRDVSRTWHGKRKYKTEVPEELKGGSCSGGSDGKTSAKV
ncbi:hypothetical protein E8E13_010943 [Curvularia kusanoi]|uniref:Uncharacterized protein n=1 Tax=Curvularia kusanoi TaxID=90978 RepID=A0A9P4TN07_CURKU|nr:hypothetical protein E8E13_010943 [Curvularia kusanoi]